MSNNVAQYTSERRGRRGGRSLRGLILRSFLLLVIALSVVLTITEAAIGFQETRQAAVERLEIVANLKRQQIVDSWPADLNDNDARRDWGWKPEFNIERSFNEYLLPNILKRYQG